MISQVRIVPFCYYFSHKTIEMLIVKVGDSIQRSKAIFLNCLTLMNTLSTCKSFFENHTMVLDGIESDRPKS